MYPGPGTRFGELGRPRGRPHLTAIMSINEGTCRSEGPSWVTLASHVPARVGEHPHTPPPLAKAYAPMNISEARRPGGQGRARYELTGETDQR